MAKNSFLLHIDSLVILDKMTNEQAGIFIKILYEYKKTGEFPDLDFAMNMAVTPFINQFSRDDSKYEKVVERNRDNGSKGGRPKEPKKPSGLLANPLEPKKADNDNDSVNDKEKDNVKVKDIYKSKREFYEKEILENSDKEQIEGYKNMVKYIFGENPIKVPLDKILKATHQLSYESFVELVEIQSKSTKKLRDILLEMNGHSKQYTILFSALKNWFK